MARPKGSGLLDERLILEICQHILLGNPQADAARLSGISESTFFSWKRKVADGRGSKLERRLVDEVDTATKKFLSIARGKVMKAMQSEDERIMLDAAKFTLERRDRANYGRDYVPEAGEPVEKIVVEFVKPEWQEKSESPSNTSPSDPKPNSTS